MTVMNSPVVLTVSQLNRYVKSLFDGDMRLQNVFVRGEISNFTNHYRTGHYYMTLKDEEGAIKAVMFRSANARLRFTPENSMRVIARGRVTVFERDGAYQLYIDDMQPDGVGALSLAFEQLKKKLGAEGLFDPAKKKPIPRYPKRVGVITSPTGAAVQDIINILSRRFPLCEMVFCAVTVQGENAAPEIAGAIRRMNEAKAADVLIVGRGGGSLEDLWAFNEEIVARAVAASEIPVISAVGHETDFTICDFVADLRAPTPSAAAELAVPDWREERDSLLGTAHHMQVLCTKQIAALRGALKTKQSRLERRAPTVYINNLRMRCDRASLRMDALAQDKLHRNRTAFGAVCSKLDALSPLKVLARGYAMTQKEGRVLSSVQGVAPGDGVCITYADGSLQCEVTQVNPKQ